MTLLNNKKVCRINSHFHSVVNKCICGDKVRNKNYHFWHSLLTLVLSTTLCTRLLFENHSNKPRTWEAPSEGMAWLSGAEDTGMAELASKGVCIGPVSRQSTSNKTIITNVFKYHLVLRDYWQKHEKHHPIKFLVPSVSHKHFCILYAHLQSSVRWLSENVLLSIVTNYLQLEKNSNVVLLKITIGTWCFSPARCY